MFYRNSALLLSSLALSLASCMNPDYDLTKEIDTTMSIQGDVSVPIGDTEMILVEDFLHLVNVPFTPDKDYHSTDNYDLTGWNDAFSGEDVKFNFDKITLEADFVSRVPMKFVLDAVAIDIEGNPIPEIETELNVEIEAGSLDSPTSSHIIITISGTQDVSRLDGLRLLIDSYAPGNDLLGTAVVAEQGVKLLNIKARLQAKVDIELK